MILVIYFNEVTLWPSVPWIVSNDSQSHYEQGSLANSGLVHYFAFRVFFWNAHKLRLEC